MAKGDVFPKSRPSPTARGVKQVRGDEPEYVHCADCGFICNTNRDTKCPLCGSENYRRQHR